MNRCEGALDRKASQPEIGGLPRVVKETSAGKHEREQNHWAESADVAMDAGHDHRPRPLVAEQSGVHTSIGADSTLPAARDVESRDQL